MMDLEYPSKIVKEYLSNIFRTKPNGMGLGLYIARQIIEPYGRLVINSEGELAGASFELTFERKVGL